MRHFFLALLLLSACASQTIPTQGSAWFTFSDEQNLPVASYQPGSERVIFFVSETEAFRATAKAALNLQGRLQQLSAPKEEPKKPEPKKPKVAVESKAGEKNGK